MQKLVTVYIDINGYDRATGLRLTNADLHGQAQEHLEEYLSKGWKIVHLACLPGSDSGGWIVVTLDDRPVAG